MNSEEARKFLPAFADGELDVEQNLRVLEQMAMDPVNTRRVLHQQQLRQACARVLAAPDCCCPEVVRDTVKRLAAERGEAGGARVESRANPPSVLARLGRWVGPLAAAAVLALALLFGLTDRLGDGYSGDGLVTARLAEQLGNRHDACALDPSILKGAQRFPAEVDHLDAALTDYLGTDLGDATLDLSAAGYAFVRAGLCTIPGRDAVHLLYRHADGRDVSLWLKPYDGQPTLDPGVPYRPPSAHTDRPTVVWRQGQTVFFLVADQPTDLERIPPALQTSARS
jgi:anti-sigma factor RsiW